MLDTEPLFVPQIPSRLNKYLTHPVYTSLRIPFYSRFFKLGPKGNRTFTGNITYTKLTFIPAAEAKGFAGNGYTNIYAYHTGTCSFNHITSYSSVLCKNRGCISIGIFIFYSESFIHRVGTHYTDHR